ncbi:MAG TPA: cytochrome C oxidase subunit IV family protein [Candidatus Hodarchaeales archaeon]|nr:cytochrome C oxidase subunit IV family protein [Candidatus Hodarchaeales archaeon]
MTTAHSDHGSTYTSMSQTYLKVWGVLLVLTIVELVVSFLQAPNYGIRLIPDFLAVAIILLLSLVKAGFVALVFQHLFWEKQRNFLIISVYILPLLIVVPMTLFILITPNL